MYSSAISKVSASFASVCSFRVLLFAVLKQPTKAGNRLSAHSMAASLLGRRESNDNNNSANATAGEDNGEAQKGLAEIAFDFLASPFSAFSRARANPHNNNFATSSN